MSIKTVVITGGAGFLGSHLCDKFINEGFRVICVDNLITGNSKNIAHLAGNENFLFLKHDVTNYIFIFALVIFFISLYIVYSTIQLVINSKYTELNTMKLVGAKLTTIKMPIILNGFFIGIFSSLILIIIGYLLIYFVSGYLPLRELFRSEDKITLIVLSLLGPIIGVAVSIVSLRKITLKF